MDEKTPMSDKERERERGGTCEKGVRRRTDVWTTLNTIKQLIAQMTGNRLEIEEHFEEHKLANAHTVLFYSFFNRFELSLDPKWCKCAIQIENARNGQQTGVCMWVNVCVWAGELQRPDECGQQQQDERIKRVQVQVERAHVWYICVYS